MKKGQYSSLDDFSDDVIRVFENAMIYNEEGSLVFKDAKYLMVRVKVTKKLPSDVLLFFRTSLGWK